jgi:hypothetical protein
LDSISLDADKRQAVLDALSSVETDLLSRGEMIAATILNRDFGVPGVKFGDYKTSLLLAAARRLATLLRSPEASAITPMI